MSWDPSAWLWRDSTSSAPLPTYSNVCLFTSQRGCYNLASWFYTLHWLSLIFFCAISPSVQQLHSIFLYVLLITRGYFLYVWKILQFLDYIFSNTQICKVVYFFSHRNITMICFTRRIQVWIFKSAMFQCRCEEDFQHRHSSTWEISLPFWSMCLWTFLMSFLLTWLEMYLFHVFFCTLDINFGAFDKFRFSFCVCYGPNLSNLKEMFVYLNQIAFFSSFTFPSLSLLYISNPLQDRTSRFEPLVKSKPAHVVSKHTHIFTQILSRLFLLHCFLFSFLFSMQFHTWHELHWNYNVVVAQ